MRLFLGLALSLLACSRDFSVPAPPPKDDRRLLDTDGDGLTPAGGDCDDSRADRSPAAREICGDGVDQDCDGRDADCRYTDDDRDGYPVLGPEPALSDCDDLNPLVRPRAPEICGDAIDQDCNGLDLDCRDADGDNDGYTPRQGDCDDTDRFAYPFAREICDDGVDQDCDSLDLDCRDADKDNDGYTPRQGDCDDTDRFAYPFAREICDDGVDQDCDTVDLDCLDADEDNDGFSIRQGECDDANPQVYPGRPEVCENGVDDDCAVEPEAWALPTWPRDRLCPEHVDQDGDGFSPQNGPHTPGGDCDDQKLNVHPQAQEVCDFFDNNCDGTIDNPDLLPACGVYDHQGSDYIDPRVGDGWGVATLYPGRVGLRGIHLRIHRFRVPAGVEVGPVPLYDADHGGSLEIRARQIEIEGALTATGAGYGGGGGGAGKSVGRNRNCCNNACPQVHKIGAAGEGRGGGVSGTSDIGPSGSAYGAGGGGGGPFGGLGWVSTMSSSLSSGWGLGGGYRAAGANGDSSLDAVVFIGSGGGGAGGAFLYWARSCPCDCTGGSVPRDDYNGGGAGGAGGGRIVLSASSLLAVRAGGRVEANGVRGTRSCNYDGMDAGNDGCTDPASGGYGGGGGSGGGVLLMCHQPGCMSIEGQVSALGGLGGGRGAEADRNAGAGGTVKVFCPGCGAAPPLNVQAGRRCSAEVGAACTSY